MPDDGWFCYEGSARQARVLDGVVRWSAGGRRFRDPFASARLRCDRLLSDAEGVVGDDVLRWRLMAPEWSAQWMGDGEFVPHTSLAGYPPPDVLWDWCEWLMRVMPCAGFGWGDVCDAYRMVGERVVHSVGSDVSAMVRSARFWGERVAVLERMVEGGVPGDFTEREQLLSWCVPLDALARWLVVADAISEPWFPLRLEEACDSACDGPRDVDDGPLYVADVVGGGTERS